MLNALTIDVEDYFHVSAFERVVRRDSWPARPSRVEGNTARILDLLDESGTKGTFFVLGWVAERFPGIVTAIVRRGHEVACHGYGHERLTELTPDRFRADVRRAKEILEAQTGSPVIGYRAPSFTVTRRTLWAIDVLIEEGFHYDSSVFPIRHDTYGMRDADPHPHRWERPAGHIAEFPLSTVRLRALGRSWQLPVAGGGYLRLLPLALVRRGLAAINERERQPAVLYFHPWEIDVGQPRLRAGLKSRFRHYVNLGTTFRKVRSLLTSFRFAPMAHVLRGAGLLASSAGAA